MSAADPIRGTLESAGLGEYAALLIDAGLSSIDDLATVTEEELLALGVDKLFHRKKLLKLSRDAEEQKVAQRAASNSAGSQKATVILPAQPLISTGQQSQEESQEAKGRGDQEEAAEEEPACDSAAGTPKEGQRVFGGDRISVEILGARGNTKQLSEREFYVKAALCTYANKMVTMIADSVRKTGPCRGPFPVWGSEPGVVTSPTKRGAPSAGGTAMMTAPRMDFFTDFRTQCLSFELKEKHLISDNKCIGLVIFPPRFFHKFTADTITDNWFPLRLDFESEGAIEAYLRLRFSVPGGCPKAAPGKTYHVKGVSMATRKLRVTVFEAHVGSKLNPNHLYGDAMLQAARVEKATFGEMYVQLEFDVDSAAVEQTQCSHSATANPTFDETFEYFSEVTEAKLLKVKLRKKCTISDETIGVVMIPIQFFLAQRESTDVDEVYPLHNEKGPDGAQVGTVHLRLEVRNRLGAEKRVSYRRLTSIKQNHAVDSAPAHGGDTAAGAAAKGRRSSQCDAEFDEDLGAVLVRDDDGESAATNSNVSSDTDDDGPSK